MIKIFIQNIVLILLISFALIAQDKCKAQVNISTNIDSAMIFINDKFMGKGNISLSLEKNEYDILLMSSDRSWGSEVIKETVLISSCENEVDLNYSFESSTIVNSYPSAAVVANDSTIGYTPLVLKKKYKNITLKKEGYELHEIQLNNMKVQPKANLNFTGMPEQEPFFESSLFKILIGSAVALGATAAYFKLKADDNFDKYLETRKSDYLDNTDRYDLYSGIAFGALQLNFGALLYYFLIE